MLFVLTYCDNRGMRLTKKNEGVPLGMSCCLKNEGVDFKCKPGLFCETDFGQATKPDHLVLSAMAAKILDSHGGKGGLEYTLLEANPRLVCERSNFLEPNKVQIVLFDRRL